MTSGSRLQRESPSGPWRPLLLLIVVVAAILGARSFGLASKIDSVKLWIEGFGSLGPLVFVLVYSLGVVLALPGSLLTVAAGALFGPWLGVATVSFASTLGAGLAFLIARYFARESAARWLSRSERFRRLDSMTAEHGAVMVAVTRLVPLFPFNLVNYGFGLTRVPFGSYVFWSWLCMLPATVLYVVGADAVVRAVADGKVPWFAIGTLVVVGVVLVLLIRIARGRLSRGGDLEE